MGLTRATDPGTSRSSREPHNDKEVTLRHQTRALVVGMEKSGLASIQFLLCQGALVRATDLKPLSELPEAAAATLSRLGVPFTQQPGTQDPAPSTQHPAPLDRKSTRLNSVTDVSRMPSSA